MDTPEYISMKSDIEVLKKDVINTNEYIRRLDVTIEKITTVSTSLSNLLSVHDERIRRTEKLESLNFQKLEERKNSQEETNQKNLELLMGFKGDLDQKISVLEERDNQILKKVDEFQKENTKNHKDLNAKLEQHEKLRWLIVGGGTVVFFVVQYILQIYNSIAG